MLRGMTKLAISWQSPLVLYSNALVPTRLPRAMEATFMALDPLLLLGRPYPTHPTDS